MLRVRQHISQLMGLGCFFEALLPFAVRDEITRQDAFWSEQMGQSYALGRKDPTERKWKRFFFSGSAVCRRNFGVVYYLCFALELKIKPL